MRAALLALALAGCATAEPPRITSEVQTQIVRVPVAVPCVLAKDIPKRPPSVMPPPGGDIEQNMAGALADVRALRDPGQHLDQLDAILKKCVKESP